MRIDLNLLTVFDAIMRLRSVTLAADHLALSQPAVSHALNRLRQLTNDPLFVRKGRGLVPTPQALAMAEPAREVIQSAAALIKPLQFDPASDHQLFRIAASDYTTLTLLPALVGHVARAAPGVSLDIIPTGSAVADHLANGSVDLSFWGNAPLPPPFLHQTLFRERYIGVAHRDHPVLASGPVVSLQAYLAASHAVVSLQNPGAHQIDMVLARMGHSRRIGLTSFSFAGNLACLRDGTLIASLPSRLCTDLSPDLVPFDLPFAVPPYDYGMIWHARSDRSESHRWLRKMVAQASIP